MLADSPGRAQSLRLSGSPPRVAIRALDDVARAADAIMYSCLAVDGVPASAPTAVALKGAIAQVARAMQEVSTSTAHVEQAALEIAEGNANLSARTEPPNTRRAAWKPRVRANRDAASADVRVNEW
ncbi:hypothetical protein [Paraburkholderia sp. BR10882]|uniref:hypothetical protein n=1 Tax=unclassified Paraburkholderia TaxID=2615204 RepID=UPI0034CD21B0